MTEAIFVIAWFATLFLILFVFHTIIVTQAKSYFEIPIEEVRYLLKASLKSFFVSTVSAHENDDNTLNKVFGLKSFHANVPFVFKLYLLPDCIVLTLFNKYATVFKRKDCQFSKNGFFSYFSIIKDDKKYMMEVGFHHKLIREWIGNN